MAAKEGYGGFGFLSKKYLPLPINKGDRWSNIFLKKNLTTLFRRQRDTSTVKKANDNLKILNIIFMTQNPYFTANQGDMFLDILTPMLPFPSKICFSF